jgi:hypothetical protein
MPAFVKHGMPPGSMSLWSMVSARELTDQLRSADA